MFFFFSNRLGLPGLVAGIDRVTAALLFIFGLRF